MATQYKPILFSTEMVQAILEGRKTQTRRIIKPQPILGDGTWDVRNIHEYFNDNGKFISVPKINTENHKSVKIKTGDILWVRETWQTTWNENKKSWDTIYKADGGYWIDDDGIMKWKPSIFMPKKKCRIFLEITDVRVERLQDISEEDAIAEGVESFNHGYGGSPVGVWYKDYIYGKFNLKPNFSFKSLWKKINGEDSWNTNPWVWVYEFKQVHHPKGFLNED